MNIDDKTKEVATYQWLLFGLLQVFNLYQILTHAMWRDELQIWSLVRESHSITELFTNMRYERFPPLWYLSLWGLSFISPSPLAMQLFHFSCSSIAQFLIMSRAPFSGTMKLAVAAGYYLSFEYCVISRAYVLGVLLIIVFCAFYQWLSQHPVMKGCILGLLANTSAFGAVLSLAFMTDELWELFRKRNSKKAVIRPVLFRNAGWITVYVLFLMIAVVFMLPPDNDTVSAGWNLTPDLIDKFDTLWKLLIYLIPIPLLKITFWNSLAAADVSMWMAVPVSIGVVSAIWFALRSTQRYLWLFIVGGIGVWLSGAIVYSTFFMRHGGTLMLLFIACVWLAAELNAAAKVVVSQSSQIAVWFILIANLIAFGIASYYHLRYDFSGSREMAEIIRDSGKTSYPIVADIDYATSSVAGYLNRPLHYATNFKAQTFIRWNWERTEAEPAEVIHFAEDISRGGNTGVLLLLNYPIQNNSAIFLARTDDAIVKDEVFYLYEYAP